jgi:hypothetical protein
VNFHFGERAMLLGMSALWTAVGERRRIIFYWFA